jgi:hypothetical protein
MEEGMSVSSINSASQTAVAQQTQAVSQNARAADGDYKAPGANRATDKDADGDYKPSSAQAQSSSAVQAALTTLKATD